MEYMQADIFHHSLSLSERIELKDHFNSHPKPIDTFTCKRNRGLFPG